MISSRVDADTPKRMSGIAERFYRRTAQLSSFDLSD